MKQGYKPSPAVLAALGGTRTQVLKVQIDPLRDIGTPEDVECILLARETRDQYRGEDDFATRAWHNCAILTMLHLFEAWRN